MPNMQKVRWGVIGVAGIAKRRVIPAMKQCELSEIVGIASRDRARAEEAAREFGMHGILFTETGQAIAEIEALLKVDG